MMTFLLKEKVALVGMAGLLSRRTLYYLCRSLSLVLAFSACSGGGDSGTTGNNSSPPPPSSSSPPPPSSISVKLQPITTALSAPVFMTAPPADNNRLFIVERDGRIKIFDVPSQSLLSTPFLDLSAAITSGGERGLLGMAFDPSYNKTRQFYVYYTDLSGNPTVARYLRHITDPNLADPLSDVVLVSVPHPRATTNHNGGMLAFGPDGCLYTATGDGGTGGSPAQDTSSLLGKILRLDPHALGPPAACTNSGLNPFANEVWSYGFRNPWRFSFDRDTKDLYIADVGEGTLEEVDVATSAQAGRGLNYGWNIMEGTLCFTIGSSCMRTGLTLPVVEYDHSQGCSIIGGYVYRGTAIPALNGTYFYADLCAGFVRSFTFRNAKVTNQFEWSNLSPGTLITSFGEDAQGELYIMTLGGGLWRISPV